MAGTKVGDRPDSSGTASSRTAAGGTAASGTAPGHPGSGRTKRSGPRRFERLRRWNPRQWGLELVLLVYAAYDGSRLLVHGKETEARHHGELLLRAERHLHAEPEHALNSLFAHHAWLGIPADFVYASLHYVITPLVLFWLYRSRRAHYAFARTWLCLATALGLVGYVLFPTAPPRLLADPDGFLDIMAQHSSIGWWGGSGSAPKGLADMTNDFAAMPSLHFGWALWCGLLVFKHARHRWVRVVGLLYPLLIAVVVMGTANHYLLDCVAGGAVVLIGWALTGPLTRLAHRLRRRARRGRPGHAAAPAVPDYPEAARVVAPRAPVE
ncbi:phosphatase PAP2 family protein [Streptacidiphilus sp. MAP5-3]|uniref:phosphatase PAP2 family protein n=1 Tax=unclassified Streptacidiphilus TaxID=2643834 RepID=UPI0035156003